VERLGAVRAELTTLKERREVMVGEALVALGRYAPFPLASRTVRLLFGLPQREIVTVTTNVPGPRQPLYVLGRRLLEIIPYVPIASTVRIGVSIFTYCDNVTFGITGDFRTSPDLDVIARGIEGGLAELLDAARRSHRSAAGRSGERGKPRRLPTAGKHDPSTSERA
jgi:WS/DGAT C-terminal domain